MRRLLAASAALLGLAAVSCDHPEVATAFEWVALRPVQCNGNQWDSQGTSESSLGRFPIDELERIDDSFSSVGIDLLEIGLVQEAGGVCLACSCPRGDLLVARAPVLDAVRLVQEFDFFFLFTSSQRPWLASFPVQCEGNPWSEVPDPFEEAREVEEWAAGEGAAVGLAGFTYRTEGFGVCLACDCSRGDRLILSVESERDEGILAEFGFARLFF